MSAFGDERDFLVYSHLKINRSNLEIDPKIRRLSLLQEIRSAVDSSPSPSPSLRRFSLAIVCDGSKRISGVTNTTTESSCYAKVNWDCEFLEAFEYPGFESVFLRLEGTDFHGEKWEGDVFEKLCSVLATYPFQTFQAALDPVGSLFSSSTQRFQKAMDDIKRTQIPGRILEALFSNRSLEALTLSLDSSPHWRSKFWDNDDEEEAFAAVNGSSALRKLLHRPHSTLSTLSIQSWPLSTCEFALLALALANNSPPLKTFDITFPSTSIQYEGFCALLASFASNTTLLSLSLTSFFDEDIPVPPDVASTFACALSINTTLQSLKLLGPIADSAIQILSSNTTVQNLSLNPPSIDGLDKAIQDNKTLTSLTLRDALDVREHALSLLQAQVVGIIKALEQNTTLTSITFESRAVEGKEVYEAIIDLLSVNVTLKTLDVSHTPLADNQAWMSSINDMLLPSSKENKALGAALGNFSRVQPTTARVFFCGHGFAGKTTLRKTMVNLLDFTFGKKFMRLCDSISIHKQLDRTMGIEVTSINHNGLEIFFWDLAGQREYHAFHDIMFPNEQGPSLFLIVCSLTHNSLHQQQLKSSNRKTSEEISEELKYWLRYIASSTKRISRRMPHVSFVLTHADKLGGSETDAILKQQVEACTEGLEQDFDSVAKVVGTFFVDSRKDNSVRTVAQHSLEECKDIVNSFQSIFSACNTARMMLAEWMKEHPDEPWMEEIYFIRLCRRELPEFKVIPGSQHRAIIAYIRGVLITLHQTGSLIYFQNLGIVLINLQWFCRDFMGGIMCRTTQVLKESGSDDHNGVWKRGEIKVILQGLYDARKASRRREPIHQRQASTSITLEGSLDVEHLVKIMLQLELCFEMDDGNDLFIPATLCQSKSQTHRRWTAEVGRPAMEFGYVGRRLKCDDENHTFLTPGFFPRLQVHLRGMFPGLPYELEKDLIKIFDDRMEVLIEFNEAPASFIDIMVRFIRSKDLDCVLEFISNMIIQNIRDLQSSTRCWQGVYLVEVALRPSCVEMLVSPEIKANQCVSLEALSSRLLNTDLVHDIENISHSWGSLRVANRGQEYTPIIELLGEKRFKGLVAERLVKVEELSRQLGIHDNGASSSETNGISIMDPSFGRIRRTHSVLRERDAHIYAVVSQLRRMELKMDAITSDIKDVKGMLLEQKERLMPKVEKLYGEFQNLNSADKAEVPQLFIFSKQESLLTKLVPGLSNFKLHFMCESQPMPHLPLRQEGIEVKTLDEGAVKSILPYMQFLLRMLSLGFRLGAPLAQAHGLMVPDLSSLIDTLISASGGVVERSRIPPDAADEDACTIHSGNIGFDPVVMRKARIWVQKLMQEKGCDNESKIHDKFGLLKNQFRDGRCAWLCDDHHRQA